MVVVFANNLVIIVEVGTPGVITTDPVPLNEANQYFTIVNAHYMFGGSTSRSLVCQPQTSLDGVEWVDQGPATILVAAGVMMTPPSDINGAFIRYRYTFAALGGSGTGAVCFDLHSRLAKK